jgi:hypothetical protein
MIFISNGARSHEYEKNKPVVATAAAEVVIAIANSTICSVSRGCSNYPIRNQDTS